MVCAWPWANKDCQNAFHVGSWQTMLLFVTLHNHMQMASHYPNPRLRQSK